LKKYYKIIKNTIIGIISISLLLWIIAPSIPCDISKKAQRETICLKMYAIEKRILAYKKDYNSYPSSGMGLSSLLQNDLNKKPYLRKLPNDLWNTPLEYQLLKNSFELISYGRDKKANTNDDIYLSKCKEII